MHTYTIEIKETLKKDIEIIAHSREEALKEVERRYNDEKIVLDSSNCVDTDYTIINTME
jgi:hypothetical protein